MTRHDLVLETIQFRLGRTADWRRGLAQKYPNDLRNMRAAERLDALAKADGRDVAADTLAALAPYSESPALAEAVSDAARDVEFRLRPAGLNDLIKTIVAKLSALQTGGAL